MLLSLKSVKYVATQITTATTVTSATRSPAAKTPPRPPAPATPPEPATPPAGAERAHRPLRVPDQPRRRVAPLRVAQRLRADPRDPAAPADRRVTTANPDPYGFYQ